MLHVTFVRMSEEGTSRLRSWLASLGERRTELAESYRRQHTRHELFHLLPGKDGPTLVVVTESSDFQEGAREFLRSEHPIDREFKQIIQDGRIDEPAVELLYDSRDFIDDLLAAAPSEGE